MPELSVRVQAWLAGVMYVALLAAAYFGSGCASRPPRGEEAPAAVSWGLVGAAATLGSGAGTCELDATGCLTPSQWQAVAAVALAVAAWMVAPPDDASAGCPDDVSGDAKYHPVTPGTTSPHEGSR